MSDPASDPTTVRPRLLVIDDEPSLAQTLAFLLRDDHEVTVVTSGSEALALLKERQDFDAILCDLTMPQVSGIDIFEWLKKTHPGAEDRMLFMTGGTFTPRAAQFVATVPNPTIEKPFNIETVQALVRQVVARFPRSASPAP